MDTTTYFSNSGVDGKALARAICAAYIVENFVAEFLYGVYVIVVVFPLVTNSLTYIAWFTDAVLPPPVAESPV